MRIRQTVTQRVAALAILIGSISLWLPADAQSQSSSSSATHPKEAGISGGQTITLLELLRQAEHHPSVVAAMADVESARGGITAADRAPLPQISASVASIDLQNGLGTGSLVGSKRLDKGVGVDWTWERGNKRTLRTQSAEFSLEASLFDRAEALIQRKVGIASAYWDLLAAQEREAVSRESLRSAEQTVSISQTRFEKGDIAEQELSRVSIEAERSRNDLATARASREIAAITLAQTAGIKATDLIADGKWLALSDTRVWTTASLMQMAQMRSDVRAADAKLKAARVALELARSLQTSDITWGGGFNNYPPDQRASIQLRAQFPWQINYQYEGEIRQAAAAVQRAEEMLRQATQFAITDLVALDLKRNRTAERLANFESQIRTRARQVLDRAEAAYHKGATPLTDLLEARRTHLAIELDAVQARADAARASAEWYLRLEDIRP